MASRARTRLHAPFLKRVYLHDDIDAKRDQYPFSLPLLKDGLELSFTRPVTIIVGENGSGKSTMLEAIAGGCGFNASGGSFNRFGQERTSALTPHLRFSWLPKVNRGFFLRAEAFFNFASHIDELAIEDPGKALAPYGGKSLHQRSHGEAFLTLFEGRFGRDAVYILDEPEAALSPTRQLVFLKVMRELERQNCQLILATHSPVIMAYPGATLLKVEEGQLIETRLEFTSHYAILREFARDPESFVAKMLED
jgi:predicted ATPase